METSCARHEKIEPNPPEGFRERRAGHGEVTP